jgi:hypothetical protein
VRDPEGPVEWQQAVDAAHWWLRFDAARQYGLVDGGPAVDVDRCRDILALGAAGGYQPGDQLGAEQ